MGEDGERDRGVPAPAQVSGYSGTPVLVTGGASFIGSHLADTLLRAGARVRIADNLSSGLLDNLAAIRNDVEILLGDLRHPDFARQACRGQQIVFHLAASHGGRGYIDTHPVDCLNNMVLDNVVFSSAVAEGVHKLIHASSACVYPTTLQRDTDDRALLAESDCNFEEIGKAFPDGEYGWAKLMGELQLQAFHKEYSIDAIACRIFTAYGERENESHAVIALIAKALKRLDPYPVWGDGKQTRNFTYVADTAIGLALAGAKLSGLATINIGTSVHTTVQELITTIFRALNFQPADIAYELDKPVGVRSRAADCRKSQDLLGWQPSISVEEGVARTCTWYAAEATSDRLARLDELLTTR